MEKLINWAKSYKTWATKDYAKACAIVILVAFVLVAIFS